MSTWAHTDDAPVPEPDFWPTGKLTATELQAAIDDRLAPLPYCAGNCNQGRAPCDCRSECLRAAFEDQSQDAGWAPWLWLGGVLLAVGSVAALIRWGSLIRWGF